MQLKAALRSFIEQGLLSLGYPTSKLGRTDTTLVLFYHGIGDSGISVADFERQLRYLTAHFELVFASEVVEPSSTGRLRVAITFDDGLKNTRNVALPLLRQYGAKATIFVLPGEIRWLWTAETRERLRFALEHGIDLDGLVLEKKADINARVEDFKKLPYDALCNLLEQISAKTQFEPSETWLAAYELMTADELRDLPEDLIELGGHSIHHPILPNLDSDRLAFEIVEGKKRLETLLGRPVKTFSYPNGDFDRRCLRLAEQHFDFAFTAESAMAMNPDRAMVKNHPHAINRLHGLECHADLPLKMHQFIRQGHGFTPAEQPTFSHDRNIPVPTAP